MYGFEGSRKLYQRKKDIFCIWVLKIIVKICEKKSSDCLFRAAFYIICFMGILKKFHHESNIEGISYLLPILENLRVELPKVWNHAIKRRPEI